MSETSFQPLAAFRAAPRFAPFAEGVTESAFSFDMFENPPKGFWFYPLGFELWGPEGGESCELLHENLHLHGPRAELESALYFEGYIWEAIKTESDFIAALDQICLAFDLPRDKCARELMTNVLTRESTEANLRLAALLRGMVNVWDSEFEGAA